MDRTCGFSPGCSTRMLAGASPATMLTLVAMGFPFASSAVIALLVEHANGQIVAVGHVREHGAAVDAQRATQRSPAVAIGLCGWAAAMHPAVHQFAYIADVLELRAPPHDALELRIIFGPAASAQPFVTKIAGKRSRVALYLFGVHDALGLCGLAVSMSKSNSRSAPSSSIVSAARCSGVVGPSLAIFSSASRKSALRSRMRPL